MTATEFLEELLEKGNECFGHGDAKGAIRHYDSALKSFTDTQHIQELRPIYQKIWANKAMAHQQLREYDKTREAAMIANAILDSLSPASAEKTANDS